MKVSEARAHAALLQSKANEMYRAASALNAACDAHRLNNADHSEDSEISATDVGKSLDDQSRKHLQDVIQQKLADQGQS